ncbi:MAG: shikimate dehydrogenase [Acidimicrobiia bacterium]
MTEQPPLTARTRVAAVIGDPVRHSLSPTIQNAAFAHAGLDWVYVAFPVAGGEGAAAVDAMRTLQLAGLNVTMPHKEAVAAACDELTPDARLLGAVNTVWRRDDGTVVGDSTDGEGFVRSLLEDGVEPAGRRVLVLGAGGASRSVVLALGRAGSEVTVAARRREAAEASATLAPGARPVTLADVDDAIGDFDVVVNVTPLGMQGEDPPFDVERLRPGQFVADTVYHPLETPLLARARARGVAGTNGVGMLIHQAALAFVRWTGRPAPVAVMRAAALDVLHRAAARRDG